MQPLPPSRHQLPGPAFACMNLVDQGSIRLIVSPEVLWEARDVLSRPKLTQKFATLAREQSGNFREHRGKGGPGQ